LVILGLLAVLGVGAYAYSRQMFEGEVVTGLRDVGTMGGAPWGIYVAFELYAVGVGFGAMLLLGAIRLMRLSRLEPLTRTLGLMTLAGLLIGYLSVMADLGQPLRAVVNIARYARPMSPFFGTFTVGLVTSLVATWVYLYLDSRRDAALLASRPTGWRPWLHLVAAGYGGTPEEETRHRQASLALAILLIGLGIAAASSAGFVFSIQVARPGWYSALQAPAFVVLAGTTAVAVLIILAAVLRKALGERERLNIPLFTWLSNLMLALTLTYLYFLLAELITVGYAGHHHEARLTEALLKGEFAWLFWGSGGLFLISFIVLATQAVRRRYSIGLIVFAAVLINLAALGKRYLIVVPSLTYGNLLPYPDGSYSPTWVEYAVILGLIAFGILLYILFIKVFPIMEVREDS
jgi:molybdopterin-containing oxidoreductase family membrane subunit